MKSEKMKPMNYGQKIKDHFEFTGAVMPESCLAAEFIGIGEDADDELLKLRADLALAVEGLEKIKDFGCDGDHAPEDSEFCTACIADQAIGETNETS